jgi:hypothetical protein
VWTLLPEVARACQELLNVAAKRFHCAQRSANAKMLDFDAQAFATVVEHSTVNFISFCQNLFIKIKGEFFIGPLHLPTKPSFYIKINFWRSTSQKL